MQTQILKYKKIQKVITESGPSLPGLPSNRAQKISRGAARAMLAVCVKKMRKTNREDWGFIRPPGTPLATFQLRMDTVWFCKVLSKVGPSQ